MNSVTLTLVAAERDIIVSHHNFVRELASWRELSVDLVRRTRYWVYDPSTETFSPGKFSGYAAMDFAGYDAARDNRKSGANFDGGLTQQAIAEVLGDFVTDPALTRKLVAWAESNLGQRVVDGIDTAKWRFATLQQPTGGLASLAGGWDGSEELVNILDSLQRSPGREPPP